MSITSGFVCNLHSKPKEYKGTHKISHNDHSANFYDIRTHIIISTTTRPNRDHSLSPRYPHSRKTRPASLSARVLTPARPERRALQRYPVRGGRARSFNDTAIHIAASVRPYRATLDEPLSRQGERVMRWADYFC